jgi:hypothetical protein
MDHKSKLGLCTALPLSFVINGLEPLRLRGFVD